MIANNIRTENYNWSERISNLRSIDMIDKIVAEIYQNPALIDEIIIHIENPNPIVAWRTA